MRTFPVGEQAALAALAAVLAIAITFFDLESTFGTAALSARQQHKSIWWWGFLLANGALSVLLWIFLQGLSPFRSWNPWAYALAIGLTYPALVRLKLTTITLNDQKVPVGLEAIYEKARDFVYARINVAVKAERTAKAQELMADNDLTSLGRKMRFDIEFDSLISEGEKVRRLKWLLEVLKDNTISDEEKKLILAIALTNGAPTPQKDSQAVTSSP
jgi:hypothetical protein